MQAAAIGWQMGALGVAQQRFAHKTTNGGEKSEATNHPTDKVPLSHAAIHHRRNRHAVHSNHANVHHRRNFVPNNTMQDGTTMKNQTDFARALLRKIGAPETEANL